MKIERTRIDILRHGACQGGEIFRGSTDVELSEEGWQQMTAAAEGLIWDRIICSPLKRCRLFAEQLGQKLEIPVAIDSRWREFDFGVWEGRDRAEVWRESADDLKQFFTDPESFTPQGGDSYQSVMERLTAAWNDLTAQHQGENILLVSHGGIIRAHYTMALGLPGTAFGTLDVPYACLTRWHHHGDKYPSQLVFHNPAGTHS